MTTAPVLPYGSWPSPITLDLVLAGGRRLAEPWLDGPDVYVLESRPNEGGRVTLLRIAGDGTATEVTPAPANVRTRVHEYGGGAWTVSDGLVVHSEFTDGHLACVQRDGATRPLTTGTDLRFADMCIDALRGRLVAVLEDHSTDDLEPVNSIVAVALDDGTITPLVEGGDLYSHPRISPDGAWSCWLTWDRPNMPWDGCELWVGTLDPDGSVGSTDLIAGGSRESITGPAWAPDGSLVFGSDRSGWWNLYRWRPGVPGVEALAPMEAEFGTAQWVFGQRQFGFDGRGRIIAIARSAGHDRLLILEGGSDPREIELDATDLQGLSVVGDTAVVVAHAPSRPAAVLRIDLATGAAERIREAGTLPVDGACLSQPRFLEFPTTDGRSAFAFYYPPANADVTEAPDGELPPLLVISHGGPTSNTDQGLSLDIQFFTSRGFAVVDVDYGGSTGYGRAYRDRLLGEWGIVDLDDCTNVATWLASQGLADPARLGIRGGSAGGYTTLCALTFRHVFSAGTSYFGVGDLAALARDTHKFESRYLDLLVAPWPEAVAVYDERSPIHFVDRIRTPVLVLQGADDRVVPQAQADELVAALARNGVPYGYLLFQGEGHGFRRAENRRRALEAELSFYAQVFGFVPADDLEPVELVGLAATEGDVPAPS
jgi:dipeptidyl aminopeptidase/acylaminoacyl peptidase